MRGAESLALVFRWPDLLHHLLHTNAGRILRKLAGHSFPEDPPDSDPYGRVARSAVPSLAHLFPAGLPVC